ncbi:GAF domain-containing protein [Sinorhizobium fredii]|uniref:GAF domain-containing protein n=1 Tax=Rhizobium fredii TaxID=380 RepID=UPI0033951F92
MTTSNRIMKIAEKLSRAPSRMQAFEVMEQETKALFDHALFTVLRFDHDCGVMTRLYSNRPDVHPIGGIKPITDSPWTRSVVQDGEPFIGRNKDDLRAVFFDHDLLFAIGCESAFNAPIRWENRVMGSMNMLGAENVYSAANAKLARLCGQLLAPLLLDAD